MSGDPIPERPFPPRRPFVPRDPLPPEPVDPPVNNPQDEAPEAPAQEDRA